MAHNRNEELAQGSMSTVFSTAELSNVRLETSRHTMERSFSQDIQEGSQELKDAAEHTRNIVLDLGLDGLIRWVSPSWADVLGTQLETIKGRPIAEYIHDNPQIFEEAMATLKSNNSKSVFVRFAILIGPSSDLQIMLRSGGGAEAEDGEKNILVLEGRGIMVYDRTSRGESHVS